jgi:soluble lytic murein transglycosylase-like protein
MPISYALDALSYAFNFNYYMKHHGKKTSVETVTVPGNTAILPLADELESAFFIAALAMAESAGDETAINANTGCLGKMQLEEGTGRAMAQFIGWEEGQYSLTDAQNNIILGGVYLRHLNKRLGLKLKGTVAVKDKTDLLALSVIAYSASKGDDNERVKSFVATIRAGGKIDWFGQAFKEKYPTWWRHIIKVVGTYRAYSKHIY